MCYRLGDEWRINEYAVTVVLEIMTFGADAATVQPHTPKP